MRFLFDLPLRRATIARATADGRRASYAMPMAAAHRLLALAGDKMYFFAASGELSRHLTHLFSAEAGAALGRHVKRFHAYSPRSKCAAPDTILLGRFRGRAWRPKRRRASAPRDLFARRVEVYRVNGAAFSMRLAAAAAASIEVTEAVTHAITISVPPIYRHFNRCRQLRTPSAHAVTKRRGGLI